MSFSSLGGIECPRTAAEGRPRPAPAGQAADGSAALQLVAPIAAHLAAGSQRALVGPAPRGVAADLTIGQAGRVAPVWVCSGRTSLIRRC